MTDNDSMFSMNVGIDEIVKHIGKNASFLQPLYEAVVNSLEAHDNFTENILIYNTTSFIESTIKSM